MATVSSTLKLNDQMSPVMRHILQAMNQTLKAMEQLDSSAQRADFSKQFGLARHEIDAATQALDSFENGLHESQRETKKLRDEQKGVGDGFKEWQKNLMAANAAISLIQQGVRLVKSGAGWVGEQFEAYNAQVTAEVQLAVVMQNNGAAQEAADQIGQELSAIAAVQINTDFIAPSTSEVEAQFNRILDKAAEIQNTTMYSSGAMITGAGEIATYVKDAEALEAAMDTLSMYAAGMSAGGAVTQQQMLDYATQLGKAFDGHMDGMTKKGFSISDEQKKFMETASDMERVALITDMIAESWQGLDKAVAATPRGAMIQFLNDYNDVKTATGEMMSPAIMQLFQVLRDNMPMIREMMMGIATAANYGMGFISSTIIPALVSGFEWLKQHIETVKTTLAILGAVALAVGVGMAIAWLISMWPLLLIIGVLALMVQMVEQAGYTSEDVIGFIGGLFGGLYAVIYNIVAELYNLFASFAEFFANFMNDPIGSIYRLFYDLCDFVLGILQTLAGAIDAVFGSSLADAVQGWRNGMSQAVTDTFGEAKIKFDRMEQMSVPESVIQGIKVAENLTNALDNLPELGNPTEGIFNGAGGYDGNIDEIGKVGSVGRINEDVTISDEDIKMLKDIASLDYQINFTQMTPNFNAGDFIINEKADADEILGYIEASVSESLQSSLYVHN